MSLLSREVARRRLVGRSLSLGALTMLTGCDFSDTDAVQRALHAVSRWNDRVQEALFSDTRLAATFLESDVKGYRFNAFYPAKKAPRIDAASYRLVLAGAIADKRPWSVDQLHALSGQQSQITRHVCVEGWSYIGKWSGPPLRTFLERIGADMTAKYVGFESADGYYGSIDMPTALHPQTIMAFRQSDKILPAEFGFPFKVRMPTKLGFKNPKWVTTMYVTDRYTGGFWSDRGYNWFSGS